MTKLTKTEIARRYRARHPEKSKEWSKKFYASEIGKKVSERAWKKRIETGKLNDYNKKRYQEDLNYKISQQIRTRLNLALKSQGIQKKQRSIDYCGCSLEEFKIHIEKQFQEGMTWDNWGEVWEVDHIKPCAAFDLTDPDQQKACFHYTNQQPLFSLINRKKADIYDWNEEHEKRLLSIK